MNTLHYGVLSVCLFVIELLVAEEKIIIVFIDCIHRNHRGK